MPRRGAQEGRSSSPPSWRVWYARVFKQAACQRESTTRRLCMMSVYIQTVRSLVVPGLCSGVRTGICNNDQELVLEAEAVVAPYNGNLQETHLLFWSDIVQTSKGPSHVASISYGANDVGACNTGSEALDNNASRRGHKQLTYMASWPHGCIALHAMSSNINVASCMIHWAYLRTEVVSTFASCAEAAICSQGKVTT